MTDINQSRQLLTLKMLISACIFAYSIGFPTLLIAKSSCNSLVCGRGDFTTTTDSDLQNKPIVFYWARATTTTATSSRAYYIRASATAFTNCDWYHEIGRSVRQRYRSISATTGATLAGSTQCKRSYPVFADNQSYHQVRISKGSSLSTVAITTRKTINP